MSVGLNSLSPIPDYNIYFTLNSTLLIAMWPFDEPRNVVPVTGVQLVQGGIDAVKAAAPDQEQSPILYRIIVPTGITILVLGVALFVYSLVVAILRTASAFQKAAKPITEKVGFSNHMATVKIRWMPHEEYVDRSRRVLFSVVQRAVPASGIKNKWLSRIGGAKAKNHRRKRDVIYDAFHSSSSSDEDDLKEE
ncbi:uncharacterized protein V1516DRAFT_689755 [Lipomyces oligophaga]|uniref:uncharacterized protein n=1 Tax=Lipomyces oligophaga TaxID=45792 RepID=UPI0034CF7104